MCIRKFSRALMFNIEDGIEGMHADLDDDSIQPWTQLGLAADALVAKIEEGENENELLMQPNAPLQRNGRDRGFRRTKVRRSRAGSSNRRKRYNRKV